MAKVIKKYLKNATFLGSIRAIYGMESKRDVIFIAVVCLFTIMVFLLPTGFENSGIQSNSVRCKAKIIQVDNEYLITIGPVKYGHQKLEIQVLSGEFKGNSYSATNNLVGKMEMDKVFVKGDNALAVLTLTADKAVSMIQVMDHYRTDKVIILCTLFIVLTFIVMGWMGLKILLTFIFSAIMLIKVLYPLMLNGFEPIISALIITTFIAAVILFLVGGLSKRALSAFLGVTSGILVTAVLAFLFTNWFKIHGVVRPFAEMLLYTGYGHLNMVNLFIGGIFLGASGAMTDISMDIAAAMDEIKVQQPAITRLQLMKSGYIVARQAAGTMSTTLLLAYSAECTAMIMTFISQGIPLENIINMVWVSSEIIHTLVGCFGLILVAPLTVFAGGMLLKRN